MLHPIDSEIHTDVSKERYCIQSQIQIVYCLPEGGDTTVSQG